MQQLEHLSVTQTLCEAATAAVAALPRLSSLEAEGLTPNPWQLLPFPSLESLTLTEACRLSVIEDMRAPMLQELAAPLLLTGTAEEAGLLAAVIASGRLQACEKWEIEMDASADPVHVVGQQTAYAPLAYFALSTI